MSHATADAGTAAAKKGEDEVLPGMGQPRRSFVRRLPPLDIAAVKAKEVSLTHDEVVQRELAINTIFSAPHPESLIPTPVGSQEAKQSGQRRSPPFRGKDSERNASDSDSEFASPLALSPVASQDPHQDPDGDILRSSSSQGNRVRPSSQSTTT
eukprot:INCI15604.1.p1 GENE.INCI15604.1~~INCI15604.1.p1  ORF type:complete len:154 (-),score=26.69 INCI15604.1:72-533(-)